MAIDWNATFGSFGDVGSAIGTFVYNLIFGLAPALLLLVVLVGVFGIIYAVFNMVKGMINKSGHKRG